MGTHPTLASPRLLVCENDDDVLDTLGDDDIEHAGMLPSVQRELRSADKTVEQRDADFAGRRVYLQSLEGPTIAVMDFDLQLSDTLRTELRNADYISCLEDADYHTNQIDGLVLAADLIRHRGVSPLLLVIATQHGAVGGMETAFLALAKRFERTDRTFLCLRGTDITEPGFRGYSALKEVPDFPRYLRILKYKWDEWVCQDSFLRYWMLVWSEIPEGEKGNPGHPRDWEDCPGGAFRDTLAVDAKRKTAFKCFFCGRRDPSIVRQEDRVHLEGIAETVAVSTACAFLRRLGMKCKEPPSEIAHMRIHWPSAPGAAFLYRLQQFARAMDRAQISVSLGLDTRLRKATLTVWTPAAYHFWGAVLTKHSSKGARNAIAAFRDLLACRLPDASDLTNLRGDVRLTLGIDTLCKFRAVNEMDELNGNRILRPMCHVSVAEDAIILSWPIASNE